MANVLAGTSPEGRNRIMIAAAVVFAAIAATLLFVALQNQDDEGVTTSVSGATTEVVVASQTILPNTKLTADMLELQSVPADQVLSGAYTEDVELAVGLPARFPLQKGEQISTTKVGLDAIRDEKDLALVLAPGMRGFSVQASEVTAVGGLLLPGNFVDVIGVRSATIEEEGQPVAPPVAVTVLQNIQVLSVAQEAQEPIPSLTTTVPAEDGVVLEEAEVGQGVRAQRPEDVERQPGARSVTLAVTPQQAQLLALLQGSGDVEIWLTLRPADDNVIVPTGETELPPALVPAP